MSRDDSDLFFFIELLVKLEILFRNIVDIHKSFALTADFYEFVGNSVEVTEAPESFVKEGDFFISNSCVPCEKFKCFTVFIEDAQIFHVFVNFIESILCGSSCEQDCSKSSFNCVLDNGWFVVRGRVNPLYVNLESIEKCLIKIERLLRGKCGLWFWSWLSFLLLLDFFFRNFLLFFSFCFGFGDIFSWTSSSSLSKASLMGY